VLGRSFEGVRRPSYTQAVQQGARNQRGGQNKARLGAAEGSMSAVLYARQADCPHPSLILFLTTSSRPFIPLPLSPLTSAIAVLCERVSHFYGGSAGQLCEQQKRTPTPCYSPRSNYAGQGVGGPTGDPSCRHGWTETVRIETATSVIADTVVVGVIGTLGFLNFSQFELWNRKAGL